MGSAAGACAFIDTVAIGDDERARVTHRNAEELLRIGAPVA